jgi:D-alanyl-D-alanine carboxypeptidase
LSRGQSITKFVTALVVIVTCDLSVLLAPAAPVRASETSQAEMRGKIQRFVDTLPQRSGAPGVTVAVAMPNGDILEFAAGMSDVESGFAMLPDDRLASGSIGKNFVGAYAAALASEGVIDLNAKISKYLKQESWFKEVPNGGDITLRMLLNHTAGMSEWYKNLPRDMTKEQLLDLLDPRRPKIDVLRYSFKKEPDFKPGTRYAYSDSNLLLAALVLEAATHRDYNEEIMRRFFYPLRMRHTAPSLSTTEAGYAQGYYEPSDNPLAPIFAHAGGRNRYMEELGVQPVNPRFEGAGGGITTTSHDLALWAKTLFENRAFKGDYLGIAKSSCAPYDKEVGYVGMGMFVWDPTQGYKLASKISGVQYGHLGQFLAHSASMMYFAEHKIAIAMMFNAIVTRENRHLLPTELGDLVVTALSAKAPGADKR